jgi:hypothetical protein
MTLSHGYGGWYEIAYPKDGRIEKANDILYIVCFTRRALLLGDSPLNPPSIIIKTSYIDDTLVILRSETLRVYSGKRQNLGRARFNLFIAESPFLESRKRIAFDPFILNQSRTICNVFVMHEEENLDVYVIIDFNISEDKGVNVKFDFHHQKTEVRFGLKFWERVYDSARSSSKHNSHSGWV